MIVINVKESESLDKALKKFKKKFEKTGVVKELRSRQSFEKPCITKRMQKIRAAYKQKMQIADVEG
ncbi:MAG: 30S ribosomal protein S21 [Bacteroidetes bacterium]|nr:30S ribosomal protein S21 [Bacteroidota bacterium]